MSVVGARRRRHRSPTASTTGEFDINAPVADADTKLYTVDGSGGHAGGAVLPRRCSTTLPTWTCSCTSAGNFVDLSASGAADEQVTLLDPADGTYDVFVNGFTTPGRLDERTIWPTSSSRPSTAGNLTLSPNPVRLRRTWVRPSTVTATWTGLETASRYFGVISYAGSDVITFVSIG